MTDDRYHPEVLPSWLSGFVRRGLSSSWERDSVVAVSVVLGVILAGLSLVSSPVLAADLVFYDDFETGDASVWESGEDQILWASPSRTGFLVGAEGYSGDPESDPAEVVAEICVTDATACPLVRVRVGCDPSESDAECIGGGGRVYSASVEGDGTARFDGVAGDVLEFFHDDAATSAHAVADCQGPSITTAIVPVHVDLRPPTVEIVAPAADSTINLAFVSGTPGWSLDGADALGTLEIDVHEGAPGVLTVRYAGGEVLEDAEGPLEDRQIVADGELVWPSVEFPTADAVTLSVEVRDGAGNVASDVIPLFVDVVPPTPVSIEDVVTFPDTPRSGRHDVSWTASVDDLARGGDVDGYQLLALSSAPGDWDLAFSTHASEVSPSPTPAFSFDGLGVDRNWAVGVRAVDDAENPSSVTDYTVDTRLSATTFDAACDLALVAPGDLDGDGRDDLACASAGSVVVLPGSDPPDLAVPIAVPLPEPSTAFGSWLAGAGDVDGDGLDDLFVGAGDLPAGYLFFGSDDPAELVEPDVVIGLPGTALAVFSLFGPSFPGRGDFADVGATVCSEDLARDCFEDFPLAIAESVTGETHHSVFVVLGRRDDDWGGLPLVERDDFSTPCLSGQCIPRLDLPGDPEAACLVGAVRIDGVYGPGDEVPDPAPDPDFSLFGSVGGLLHLDDEAGHDFADLVLTTAEASPSQFAFLGRHLTTCTGFPGLDLGDAAFSRASGVGSFGTRTLAPRPATLSGGLLVEPGAQIVHGYPDRDRAIRWDWDGEAGNLVEGDVVEQGTPGAVRWATSVSFAGNLDRLPRDGGVAAAADDVIVGVPTDPGGEAGRLLLLTGWTTEGPAETRELVPSLVDPGLGTRLVGGFDFDGDGLPDVAAVLPATDEIVLIH